MASSTLHRTDDTWWEHHVDDWVDAGLISDDQADAILRFEHPADERSDTRLSLIGEAAAYLGSVLALTGGAVAIGHNWADMAMAGRLAVGVAIAVVGFAAGTWLVGLAEDGTRRLGSFLWTIGAGGLALTAGVVADGIGIEDEAWIAVAVGLPVLVVGLALWRNQERPLQLLTAVVGFSVLLGGGGELVGFEPWIGGLVVWSIAVLGGGAAFVGWVRPRQFALALAVAGAMLGALTLMELDEHLGPAVAAVTAAVAVVLALRERLVPFLVVSVMAFLLAVQVLIQTTFSGAASSLVVAIAGLAIVVGAVVHVRRPVAR